MGNSQQTKYDRSTTAEAVCIDFAEEAKGKHVVVTGANCGIGLETARALASVGSIVTLCSRSPKNGENAVNIIKKSHPDAQVSFAVLDLGSFESIRKFAADYIASGNPLHVLVNNAGVMANPRTLTSNGLEEQLGVNHVGHFLLTTQLLSVLERSGTKEVPSRVINVASIANWIFGPEFGVDISKINDEASYNPWRRYGESKLANILFSKELQRRMETEGKPVISVSLHPGD